MNGIQPETRSPPRSLILARVLWSVIAVSGLVYYAYWAADAIRLPLLSCAAAGGACNPLFLSVEDVAAAEGTRLPVEWIARSFFVINILTSLVFILVSVFIAWRRSDDRFALWISTILLCLGAFGYVPDNPELIDPETVLYRLTELFAFIGYFGPVTALYYFPDGRFVPSWSRWVCLALSVVVGSALLEDQLPQLETDWLAIILPVVLFAGLAVGVGSMVYRFRRVASPAERQQIKWVAFGFSTVSLGVIAWVLFDTLLPSSQPSLIRTGLVAVTFPLVAVLGTFLPISVAVAVMRYRLWDVDVIIRRTLQYALLTGLLALVYFGGVVILQGLLGPLTGDENSPLVTVITTLGIAALFSPLRRRVQEFIDRRFYRKKYNAERSLARFAAAARDEVDLSRLSQALLGVVGETMQPDRASLWLGREPK